MDKVTVQSRDKTGRNAKSLLTNDVVPGVMYDSNENSENIKIALGDLVKILREATTSTVMDLSIEGKDEVHKVMVKEVDYHPTLDTPRHVAFFKIDETATMKFTIPITTTGVSPAVKNNIGVLITPTATVEVKSTLEKLVPKLEIDISDLTQVGQTITLSDIELPEGMELLRQDLKDRAVAAIADVQKAIVTEEEEAEDAEGEEGEEAEGEEGAEGEAAEGEENQAEESQE